MLPSFLFIAIAAFTPASAAPSFTGIYAFCQERNCGDGQNPFTAPPFVTASGDIIGTTQKGGDNTLGVIWRLANDGSSYSYSRIHSFCADPPACHDGGMPLGHLIQDMDGNFYGVAAYNSKVYELTPNAARTAWIYKVVYSFHDFVHGYEPGAGLSYEGQAEGEPYDGHSPLYGTTMIGGSASEGAIYQLTPHDRGWTEKVIYNFCSRSSCSDGGAPGHVALMMDKGGKVLTGTTAYGGANNGGVVFQLKKHRTGWSQTVLHDFCSIQPDCADGQHPDSGVIVDRHGDFYGTTISTSVDGGTVYKLETGTPPKYTMLYRTCQTGGCPDGDKLYAPPVMDALGNLYVVTMDKGLGGGAVLQLTKKHKTYKSTLLHVFCSEVDCADGQHPFSPVVLDPFGNLFGTTNIGGSRNEGVVFELKP